MSRSVLLVLARRPGDGALRVLPSPVDFYWRRHMSAGVHWPRRAHEPCLVKMPPTEGEAAEERSIAALDVAR